MKKISVCILFAACFALFTACEKEKEDYPFGGPPCPPTYMLILKYPNPDDFSHVVATQHLARNSNDSTSLYLYAFTDLNVRRYIDFMQSEMPIEGTSPNIPLTNGYYLIDWKWMLFFPLTTNFYALHPCEIPFEIKYLLPHSFVLDTTWSEVKDLATVYHVDQSKHNLEGTEYYAVTCEDLDRLYRENNSRHPEPYGGITFYYGGFSVIYMHGLYENHFNNDPAGGSAFIQSYVHFCDSLQAVYQKHLIEIIQNGKINTIGYK